MKKYFLIDTTKGQKKQIEEAVTIWATKKEVAEKKAMKYLKELSREYFPEETSARYHKNSAEEMYMHEFWLIDEGAIHDNDLTEEHQEEVESNT